MKLFFVGLTHPLNEPIPINISEVITINDQEIFKDKLTFGDLKSYIWNIIKKREDDINNGHLMKLWKVEDLEEGKEKWKKLENLASYYTETDIENFGGNKLLSTSKVSEVFQDVSGNRVHIIVQPPSATTGKRKMEYLDLDKTNITKKEKLDLNSPASIVRFFTEDDENKKWIKADFTKPSKLCDNKFNFKREGRDDALCKTFDYIYDRHCGISNAKSHGDKELHPLLALQSAPGGGKSFFFDELANLKDEDINLISHYLEKEHPQNGKAKEVINIIRNLISINITYNGSSLYNEDIMDGVIQRGLRMRILWSYFFDENKLDWIAFCNKFRHLDSLSTYMVIESIMYHSKKSILLCIDETMRVLPKGHSDLKNLKSLLNELYEPYRAFSKTDNKFYFVISTLDTINICQTDSQRPIRWIPLRRLILPESAH